MLLQFHQLGQQVLHIIVDPLNPAAGLGVFFRTRLRFRNGVDADGYRNDGQNIDQPGERRSTV